MSNIKYEMFKRRRNFNIINWLKQSKDRSYDSFVEFLSSKSVISPGEEYFNKAISLLDSIEKRVSEFQEKKVVEEPVKKETIPIEVEISLPQFEETTELIEIDESPKVSPEKPKSRRRRRKKDSDES